MSPMLMAAPIYKCPDANGVIRFQGKPCPVTRSLSQDEKLKANPLRSRSLNQPHPDSQRLDKETVQRLLNQTGDGVPASSSPTPAPAPASVEPSEPRQAQESEEKPDSFRYQADGDLSDELLRRAKEWMQESVKSPEGGATNSD